MSKILNIIKCIFTIIILTILTTSAFGGGCLYWLLFASIFKFNPTVTEVGFYISMFIGIVLGHLITPKVSDKLL